MKKLLLYNDAKYLGGHELQIINALHFLQDKYKIFFIVCKKNTKFLEILKNLSIEIIEMDYCSSRLQNIRSIFSLIHISRLVKIIRDLKPDLILNVQGNIELGSVMLLASKISRIKNITYIPLAHRLKEVANKRWISETKDFINEFYFKIPDAFITINNHNKDLIKKRGVDKPIYVVFNGIDFKKYTVFDKIEAKKKLGLDCSKINIALIGRIQFWHKGHDILLNMVEKYAENLKSFKFLIVGTGEDENKMKSLIKQKKLEDMFLFLGHRKDLSLIYSAIDGLVIPSRFEGFEGTPMVLLEGIYYQLPIVMSNLPGTDLYLDKDNLFEKGNIDDLYKKILSIGNKKISVDKRDMVINMHSIDKFQKTFFDIIEKNVE